MKNTHKYIPIDVYHAHEALSKTVISAALKSARAYQRAVEGDFTQTKSMALGDAVHAYVLEPERFDEMYTVRENKNKEKFLEPTSDEFMKITSAEYLKFHSMVTALKNCEEFQELFKGAAMTERSFFAEIPVTDENGDPVVDEDGNPVYESFKCRPDFIVKDGWLVDPKTCGGMSSNPSSPEEFSKSFYDYCYDIQMVLYMNVVEAVTGKRFKGMKFVCVDAKNKDSGVKIYTFERGVSIWWKIGAARLKEGLANVIKYRDLKEFPVYDGVNETDLPLSYNATNYAVEKDIL